MSLEVAPHGGNYFQMCAIGLFSTFKICYVSTSVIFFHHYFYGCMNIVDVIGGPLIGEFIVRLPDCAISHMDMTMLRPLSPTFVIQENTW